MASQTHQTAVVGFKLLLGDTKNISCGAIRTKAVWSLANSRTISQSQRQLNNGVLGPSVRRLYDNPRSLGNWPVPKPSGEGTGSVFFFRPSTLHRQKQEQELLLFWLSLLKVVVRPSEAGTCRCAKRKKSAAKHHHTDLILRRVQGENNKFSMKCLLSHTFLLHISFSSGLIPSGTFPVPNIMELFGCRNHSKNDVRGGTYKTRKGIVVSKWTNHTSHGHG